MAYPNQRQYPPKNDQPKKTPQAQTEGILLVNRNLNKFLKIRYWARCLGVDIGHIQPGVELNFEAIRNAQTFGQVFSFHTLFELNDICEAVVDSIKATGTFESMATEAGSKKDAIVEISNGIKNGLTPGIYLIIYKGLDSNKVSAQFESYKFNSTTVMKNYDHTTGRYEEVISNIGEFKKFVKCISESVDAFTMAQAHAVQDANNLTKTNIFVALSAITASLGIDINRSVSQMNAPQAENRTSGSATYTRPPAKPQGQNQNKSYPNKQYPQKQYPPKQQYQQSGYNGGRNYQQPQPPQQYQQQQSQYTQYQGNTPPPPIPTTLEPGANPM